MTWPAVPLRDVADVVRGVTYKKEQARNRAMTGHVPLLRATNIGGSLDLNNGLIYVPESVVKASQQLQPGDIVLASSSGSLSVVGKSAPLRDAWDGTFGAFCAVIRSSARIDARYLSLYLRSHTVRSRWSEAARGTNINNLKRGDLEETPIPCPPLDEQRRIVDLLEDHLSRLDAADKYLDASETRAGRLHDQLLGAALARMDGEEQPLADLLQVPLANGRSVPTQEDGFPVLRLTALRGDRIDLGERKEGAWSKSDAERWLVRRGDFLVSRGNGSIRLVGRGGLVVDEPDDVAFPDTLIRVRPNADKVNPLYLALIWNAPSTRRQIEARARTTAGIHKVNQKDLGRIRLPLPSIADQMTIVGEVGEQRRALQRMRGEIHLATVRAQSLRRSLLAAAFSGRLTRSATDLSAVEEMIGA